MAELKIVCVGFNLESQVALQGLIESGANICAVVTVPSGASKGISDYVDLHALCESHSIRVIDTKDINSPTTLREIAELSPDYVFALAWNRLFSRELLTIPTRGVIGSHPSKLPTGRGRAPVPWTIIQGLRESAVSFFEMNEQPDEGKLLLQRVFKIPDRAYAYDVYKLVAEHLCQGFIDLYHCAQAGTIRTTSLPSSSVESYRSKRTPDDGHLDFSHCAEALDRLIRAASYPYPGAFTFYRNSKITVWKCSPYTGALHYVAKHGQVLARRPNALLVQTGSVPIWLEDLSTEDSRDPSSIPLGAQLTRDCALEIQRIWEALDSLRGNSDV